MVFMHGLGNPTPTQFMLQKSSIRKSYVKKKPSKQFALFLTRTDNAVLRRAARLPGSRQVRLALYQKYLFIFPHPLNSKVDRMMMNVNCNNVIHFSISLVVPRDLTRYWGGQLGIKKSVILIRFNDIILYQGTNVKFFWKR